MFYVGHFRWTGLQPEFLATPRKRGTFICLVEAESAEEAAEKLETLVEDLKSHYAFFEDVAPVYLDDLIEDKKLPAEGVLGRFEERIEDNEMTAIRPGVPLEFCEPYGIRGEPDEDGWVSDTPFISFVEEDDELPPNPYFLPSPPRESPSP